MKATRGIFVCLLISSLVMTALSIQCYTCFYDTEVPTALSDRLWNEECVSENFHGDKIDIDDGFKKCYKATVTSDGKIVSVHRGGGSAALGNFVNQVSRESEDFEVSYCQIDLCNGATSMMTSLGLIVTSFIILRSLCFFK